MVLSDVKGSNKYLSHRNMSALLTRITRQVSRMFDLNKIKMKTGSMAYVMEHRLYGLFLRDEERDTAW